MTLFEEDGDVLKQRIEETIDYMSFACNPETTASGSVGRKYTVYSQDGFLTSLRIWKGLFICNIY